MLLQARLIHCEAGRRVVLVSALEGDQPLGSALGEAADAEAAEDRAIARLLARLGLAPAAAAPASLAAEADPPSAAPADHRPAFRRTTAAAEAGKAASPPDSAATVVPPEPPPDPPPEPPPDPEDWSEELARLDLQLKRLGWSREQEAVFLNRAFGHGARSRVTVYADLLAYLRTVEDLEHGADPASAPVPLRRHELLRQCDELLDTLGWDRERARAFLSERLGAASRQHLSDEKVLEFNMLLEEEVMAAGAISCSDPNSARPEQNSGGI